MKSIFKNIKLIAVFLMAISFSGCSEDVIELPGVSAGFTFTLNPETGTVVFINTSENTRAYEWNFGDEVAAIAATDTTDAIPATPATMSTEKNPVKTFATGTYTVVLKSSNAAGASATFEDIIIINLPLPLALPITFDIANVSYAAEAFDGTAFEVVENPATGGTNDVASMVGAITNSGAAFEGIFFELATAIDLATDKTIKMNFWSDAAVAVLLKLEVGTTSSSDIIVEHTGSGWEELSFNFSEASTYSKLVLFVDGAGTTAGTFYMDDVMQVASPPPACIEETMQSLSVSDFNLTFQTAPGASVGSFDAVLTTIDNPDSNNEVNTSCKVGKIERNGGALFANNQIEFDAKLDFNANAGFKLKVWSPIAGTNVLVKLEDKTNADIFKEVSVVTTTANVWEELTFDFASSETNKYDKIILFFELNTNTTETYYIDDFMLYGTGTGSGGGCAADAAQSLIANDLNLTFVTDPGTIATKGAEVGKFFQDNVTYEYVDNPNASDTVNTSCKVGKVTNSGIELWDNLQVDFSDKLVIGANATFKMKVYSPETGYKVTIKLEDKSDGGIAKEFPSTAATTKTNEWEELTFNLDEGSTNKFDKVVLFFDLQTTNANTYYFDDLVFDGGSTGGGGGTGGSTGTCPAAPAGELLSNGGFESGESCWQLLKENGGATSISTTVANGGSNSAQIQGESGRNPGVKQERFAIGVVQPNTTYTVSFDIRATEALGEGGVVKAFTFSEGLEGGATPATLHTITDNLTSVSSTSWQTVTNTFRTPGNANQVEGGISFLVELINSAATINIDNVVIKETP
jgi:hypothetical protein